MRLRGHHRDGSWGPVSGSLAFCCGLLAASAVLGAGDDPAVAVAETAAAPARAPAETTAAPSATSAASETTPVSAETTSVPAETTSAPAGTKPVPAPAESTPVPARAEASPDSLWLRAIAIAATGDSTLPGLIDAKVDQVDSDGNVVSGKETIGRISLGADGKIERRVIREIEYGEDPSDSTASTDPSKDGKDEKEKKEQFSLRLGRSPFSAGEGVAIEARRTGDPCRVIEGIPCVSYSFTRTEGKRTMIGEAWIAESTGIPIEIQARERPLPKHVKSMSSVARYVFDGSLGWRIREMTIDAVGGFLFIKKRFHVVTTFSEHWRIDRSATPPASASPAPPASPTPASPGISTPSADQSRRAG